MRGAAIESEGSRDAARIREALDRRDRHFRYAAYLLLAVLLAVFIGVIGTFGGLKYALTFGSALAAVLAAFLLLMEWVVRRAHRVRDRILDSLDRTGAADDTSNEA